MSEHIHFLCGTETAAKVRTHFAQRSLVTKAADDFARKHGAECCVGGQSILGLRWGYDKAIPTGWRRPRGKNYIVPSKKTPEGKAFAAEIAAMPRSGDLTYDTIGTHFVSGERGFRLVGVGAHLLGDDVYLIMKEGDDKYAPADCVRIKRSEYHAKAEAEKAEVAP